MRERERERELLYLVTSHRYKTADGEYMSVGAIEPKFYR